MATAVLATEDRDVRPRFDNCISHRPRRVADFNDSSDESGEPRGLGVRHPEIYPELDFPDSTVSGMMSILIPRILPSLSHGRLRG